MTRNDNGGEVRWRLGQINHEVVGNVCGVFVMMVMVILVVLVVLVVDLLSIREAIKGFI